jgi:predicted amidohydrolase
MTSFAIALASPRIAQSLDDGLARMERLVRDAASRGARIVCFPEAYLPGLRGQDFEVPAFERADVERVVRETRGFARDHSIAIVLGTERLTSAGRQIASCVIDARGEVLGWQTKNQLDPSEDRHYVPGEGRRLFEVGGVSFGIAICHEGWRYPETVRWAAERGAKIVFHPQHTGAERDGTKLASWGAADSPYYEKAMTMRALENTIYFASVNYALRFPESATSIIDPSGRCEAYLPYGEEGVLVREIDLKRATGLLARRWAPGRHQEEISAT